MTPVTYRSESSVVHGGGLSESNMVLFRREQIAGCGSVPVISGNALRGVLRRAGAWALWTLLDRPQLSEAAVRVLTSGGALRQEAGLTVDQQRVIRRIPHLSLFGGSWRGQIEAGSLRVGKLYPVCAETSTLTGVDGPPLGRLLDLEQYARHDHGPIPVDEPAVDDTTQMLYTVETVAAGTEWRGWVSLCPWATDADRAWASLVWRSWQDDGGHVGGRSATGHGRLVADDPFGGDPDHCTVDVDATIEALSWM